MRQVILIAFVFLSMCLIAEASKVNVPAGSRIKVEDGSAFVADDLDNKGNIDLSENGVLRVQGNLDNTGEIKG